MKRKLLKFLNTPLGSIVKVFLTVVLAHIAIELGKGEKILDIWSKDNLNTYLTIGVAACIPMLINVINPEDKRYGKKGKLEDFKPETDKIKE